jgi:membrane-bound lytic murein transglycosylase D
LLVPVENEKDFLQKLADLPEDKRVTFVTYRVRKGETLKSIARKTGMSMAQLRSLNNLKSNKIRPGQELLLQSKSKLASTNPAPAKPTRRDTTHTVRSGETLWSIAKHNGIDPDALAAANSIQDSNSLTAGQKLVLPGATTLASTSGAKALEPLTYTVRSGDTLSHIAQLFKVEIADIRRWNKLQTRSALKAGQRLVLYVDDTRRLGG